MSDGEHSAMVPRAEFDQVVAEKAALADKLQRMTASRDEYLEAMVKHRREAQDRLSQVQTYYHAAPTREELEALRSVFATLSRFWRRKDLRIVRRWIGRIDDVGMVKD